MQPLCAESFFGRLKVKITILLADLKDFESTDMFSKVDPYCLLFAGGRIHGKTQWLNNCDTPEWDSELVIWHFKAGTPLQFAVFDKDNYPKLDDPVGIGMVGTTSLDRSGFEAEVDLRPANNKVKEKRFGRCFVKVLVQVEHPDEDEMQKHYEEELEEEKRVLRILHKHVYEFWVKRVCCIPLFFVMGIYHLELCYIVLLVVFSVLNVRSMFIELSERKHKSKVAFLRHPIEKVLYGWEPRHFISAEFSSQPHARLARFAACPSFIEMVSRAKIIAQSLSSFVEPLVSTFAISSCFTHWTEKEQESFAKDWAKSALPFVQYCNLPVLLFALFAIRTMFTAICSSVYRNRADACIEQLVMDRSSYDFFGKRHMYWRCMCMASHDAGIVTLSRVCSYLVDHIHKHSSRLERHFDGFGGSPWVKTPAAHLINEPYDVWFFFNHAILFGTKAWFTISMTAYSCKDFDFVVSTGSFILASIIDIMTLALLVTQQFDSLQESRRILSVWPKTAKVRNRRKRQLDVAFLCFTLFSSMLLVGALSARLIGAFWCPSHILSISSGCV